ncbi:MAG: hypothetical protein AAGF22_05315 [Pseudomonadota bacterium]
MPFLLKMNAFTNPIPEVGETGAFRGHDFKGASEHIGKGDEIYLWASENRGGEGLCARGTIENYWKSRFRNETTDNTYVQVVVLVKVDFVPEKSVLKLINLGKPIESDPDVGRKEAYHLIAYHNHNKIAKIDEETAKFLAKKLKN